MQSLLKVTQTYIDDVIDLKIEKGIDAVHRKLRKDSSMSRGKESEKSGLLSSNEVKQKPSGHTHKARALAPLLPRNKPLAKPSKKKSVVGSWQVGALNSLKLSKKDLEIPQAQKIDILIQKAQEFQDLATKLGEGYVGDIE